MGKEPRLVILHVMESSRIPVMQALREIFGVGLRESRAIAYGPFPQSLPLLPLHVLEEVHRKLTEAGAVLEEIDVTPRPEVEPKDFLERLDDDLFD
jgi:ribosomal protein L7/L12